MAEITLESLINTSDILAGALQEHEECIDTLSVKVIRTDSLVQLCSVLCVCL